jgi:hypothetical protein
VFQCKPSIASAGQIKAAYAVTSASQSLEGADTDIAKSACEQDVHQTAYLIKAI